jgi:hypothetical protein|tara:strand:+ start:867 stop:1175 length:309 start_codon:yes stop_codon:yes gene_type:complete
MIDTDKYEVRAYGKWSVGHEGQHDLPEGDIPINVNGGLTAIAYSQADAQLIADAPLLLAEVKRLREEVKDYDACLQNLWDRELIPEDTDIWDEVKELLEVIE